MSTDWQNFLTHFWSLLFDESGWNLGCDYSNENMPNGIPHCFVKFIEIQFRPIWDVVHYFFITFEQKSVQMFTLALFFPPQDFLVL